jgi:hypothetical protein
VFLAYVLTFEGQAAAAVPKLTAILDIDPRFAILPVTLADLAVAKLLTGERTRKRRHHQSMALSFPSDR